MKNIVKNVLALIVGIVVGSVVNMSIVMLGPMLIPAPPGVDGTSMESLAATMHLFEPRHFISPFLAHAAGTFAGAFLAFFFAASYKKVFAYVVGGAFLLGGISMVFVIPSPIWFTLLDLIVAYIPMAWLAVKMGRRFQGSREQNSQAD